MEEPLTNRCNGFSTRFKFRSYSTAAPKPDHYPRVVRFLGTTFLVPPMSSFSRRRQPDVCLFRSIVDVSHAKVLHDGLLTLFGSVR
jgi:hypothetical protein